MRIYKVIIEQMIEHASRAHPTECCGLLYGSEQIIDGIQPASNQKESSSEFLVPPEELFTFFKRLRQTGKNHLGIYHSHPYTDPLPSQRDEAEFYYPHVSYWIVSLKLMRPKIRCFRWSQGSFRAESFSAV